MQIKTNAKINLTLDILGKRGDGYHLLKSVMQPIPLYDTINIEKADKMSIKCNLPYIPTDSGNLVYKAAEVFFKNSGIDGKVSIDLNKRVPVGAGLGGGSANAAGILLALNEMYNAGVPSDELKKWAYSLGADVPFFIDNVTSLAEGVGEVLSPCSPLPACELMLVMPGFPINTKWAYTKVDEVQSPIRTDEMLKALASGDIERVSACLDNHFQKVISREHPQINHICGRLKRCGALGACMTGSGSAVFGIFEKGTVLRGFKRYFQNCRTFCISIE